MNRKYIKAFEQMLHCYEDLNFWVLITYLIILDIHKYFSLFTCWISMREAVVKKQRWNLLITSLMMHETNYISLIKYSTLKI